MNNNNTLSSMIIMQQSASFENVTTSTATTVVARAPEWMVQFVEFRKRLFLRTVEPIIVTILGPVVDDDETELFEQIQQQQHPPLSRCGSSFDDTIDCSHYHSHDNQQYHNQYQHRRLGFLPEYVSNVNAFKETSMSFATLIMLFVTLSCVFLIFLSCFYHNQKTSPLFISPRRHRLPRLVPPPLPVDGYFKWVKVCFYMSDEEIINRIGYDSLIFLRFHRLAFRCIVKMSVFSFVVLLPLNFTGGGHANAQDLKEYVGSLFFTDFLRFTMANVVSGSPRLWVHCFAAYLLTIIVVRELLIEYETFNSIRHRYLLSREPHLRTVLVTNIPRHLRSASKITNYFKHVYPNAVNSVFMCQNLIQLEKLIKSRTGILSKIEQELLLLCRSEKRKLYEQSTFKSFVRQFINLRSRMEDCGIVDGSQERLAKYYGELEILNSSIEQEQRRRKRVMKMLDKMEAGDIGSVDIDYVLASPFFVQDDPTQRRVLGLNPNPTTSSGGASTNTGGNTTTSSQSNSSGTTTTTNDDTTTGTTDNNNNNHNNTTTASTNNDNNAAAQQQQQGGDGGSGSGYNPPSLGGGGGGDQHQGGQQQQRWPESIPEGNEDDEEGGGSGGNGGFTTGTGSGVAAIEVNDSGSTIVSISQLRSRSPSTAAAGVSTGLDSMQQQQHGQSKSKKKSSSKGRFRGGFAKAKRAIAQYSRFNPDGVSFLGRPMRGLQSDINGGVLRFKGGDADSSNPNAGLHKNSSSAHNRHIEDHINEVTDKAFVVMRTFTAATIAIQSMHSSKPGSMQVSTAPEPRDILWQNIYVSKGARRTRTYLGEILVLLIITFYVVPVALVSLLVSESALISSSPRLAQLDQASAFFSAAIALVQPLCIVGLQQLLPPLFMVIGQAEGITSFSEVQMRAFSRYFLFQVINVFLVTTIAGSIFDTVAIIIESPESAFEMLGNSLPRMSSFFITLVTIKTFLALGFELVRTMSLVQATLRYIFFPNATLRTKRTVILGMRAIDDPGWFPFHKILAQDMLVVVLSVVFAVVAPLVLLPCALFCLFSRIMWTHHHLYVYESVFESGGQFWPKIFRRFVFGLIIAQMTITGQFILKDARHEAYATIALMFLTYFFLRSTRARYDPASSTLPLEVATVMDISLQQEEQQHQDAAQRQKQQPMMSPPHEQHGPPSNSEHRTPVAETIQQSPAETEPGALIGRFDPFQKAYLQPALRANPRAKPEQPFPPAQLGREETGSLMDGSRRAGDGGTGSDHIRSDDSMDDDWQDSGATVRLKSLNQQDRRLINRWWNDHFQSAGKLNIWPVLIGEECGTLTISGASSAADVQMHHEVPFSPKSPASLV